MSTTNITPHFFGFSVISGDYKYPTSESACKKQFGFGGIKGYYEDLRDDLGLKLQKIFNPKKNTYDPEMDLFDLIKDVCNDSDESNIAYKFYANQIIKKINDLSSYIEEAQMILSSYDETKLIRLQLLDTFCKKIEIDFSCYYSYDPEEQVFKIIEEEREGNKDDYSKSQLNDAKPSSYDELRNDEVATHSGSNPATKTITCFNELNLLDRLKFIKLYYDCNEGKTDALFPNDDKKQAYPSVKVEESKIYNKETYATGQLELFYIGYLIDRDGPIGALCSFIELKSIALLKNIEIETMRIKALNGYLAYLNQASTSLNGRDQNTGVPHDTYGIVSLICSGIARNIKQLTINNETFNYLVLQRDYPGNTIIDENNGYHLSKTKCYMLIRLDVGVSKHVTHHCDSPFIPDREFHLGDSVSNVVDPSTGSKFSGVEFYEGFEYNSFDCTGPQIQHEVLIANIAKSDDAIKFLPKELDISIIPMETILGYSSLGGINWDADKQTEDHESATKHARMIDSWQRTIDAYTGYINASIESTNTDIEVWRSKMNTWDSLASTIRHRDYEIRQNLVSRSLK